MKIITAKTWLASAVCLICALTTSLGQSKLTGTVKDAKGVKVPDALVWLTNGDSVLISKTNSNTEGVYSLPLPAAGQKYFVRVRALGYQEQQKVWDGTSTIDWLMLDKVAATNEVDIEAKRLMITNKNGKMVVDVENSLLNQGLNAFDLLQRTPGVIADQNSGSVSLAGKGNVTVLIDNKPTQLSTKDLQSFLRSLNSSQVASIEVINNPGAQYDAQGTGGILNINLKQNKRQGYGYSSELSAGSGKTFKSNAGLGGYVKTAKWNLTGNYNFQRNDGIGDYRQQRTYPNGEVPNLQANQFYIESYRNHNLRAVAEYTISPKSTIGLSNNFSINENWNIGRNFTETKLNNALLFRNQTVDRNDVLSTNIMSRLTYDHKFKLDSSGQSKGPVLNAYLDFGRFSTDSKQRGFFQFFPGGMPDDSSWNLTANQPSANQVSVLQADLRDNQQSKGFGYETGVKITTLSVVANPTTSVLDQKNGRIPGINQSFRFRYSESIVAAYAIAHYKTRKWQWTAGLRGEQWNALGKQADGSGKFTRDTLFVLPSFTVSYQIDSMSSISLAATSRIDRPSYNDLNPTGFYSDPYTIFTGNPALRPQISQSAELTYSLWYGLVNLAVQHTERTNLIQQYMLSRPREGETIQTLSTQNIGKQSISGFSVGYNPSLWKGTQAQFYFFGYRTSYSGDYQGLQLNSAGWAGNYFAGLQSKLSKSYSLQANLWGNTRQIDPAGTSLGMSGLDVAIQKSFANERGSARIAVQDLLNTSRWLGVNNLGTVNTNNSYRWDNRRIMFTLAYNFSSGQRLSEKTFPNDERMGGGRR